VDGTPIKGTLPVVLPTSLRITCTIAVIVSLNCFLAFLYSSRKPPQNEEQLSQISWESIFILLVPFALCYTCLLLPRGLNHELFDRYLLPLMLIGVILLLRIFEERVEPNLPFASYLLLLLFAFFAVAGTHDAFSLFRAKAEAIAELRAAGVPDTSIDGGFEHNGMTQIDLFGYINDPRIRVPAIHLVEETPIFPEDCKPQLASLTPAIVPGYALSFDPKACGGLSGFPAVTYRNWLGEREVSIYIVKTEKGSNP
jgi:hypothetical protein